MYDGYLALAEASILVVFYQSQPLLLLKLAQRETLVGFPTLVRRTSVCRCDVCGKCKAKFELPLVLN